jgi:hypothetical protein
MMARHAKTETVQVGLRLKESLRATLDEAARERGVSMNAELVARLERSVQQDRIFGSAAAQQVAFMTAAAYDMAGRMRGAGKPDWTKDPDAHRAAVFAAINSLLEVLPPSTPEQINLEIEAVRGAAIARRLRAQGIGQ